MQTNSLVRVWTQNPWKHKIGRVLCKTSVSATGFTVALWHSCVTAQVVLTGMYHWYIRVPATRIAA